jgi:DNA ligase (NAD+)
VELPRIIYALGIIGVGETAARLLAEEFGTLEALQAASAERIEAVSGIGPIIAGNVYEFLRRDTSQRMLARMKEGGVKFKPYAVATASGELAGKVFVITGTLSRPRNHFKQQIEARGGKVTGSVSKNTDYLLCGADPGSKLDKARKLGVEVIDEDRFLALTK